ncbi:amidase family protein, partial [Mycoplasmopsis bovis]|uniref:amidase family protein n=1 Tax=Mycoplasmopsis bovis TaxID=28903 RepID=UPI003D2C3B2B
IYTCSFFSIDGILENSVFTIKDNYATDDQKATASSMILKNFKPYYNATAVQKLLDAGAIPVAKVHCDESKGLVINPNALCFPVPPSANSSQCTLAT